MQHQSNPPSHSMAIPVPLELVEFTTIKAFVRPLTRDDFELAIEALGGRSAFAQPRKYGSWLRDRPVLLYPPAKEPNLSDALLTLRKH